MLPKIVLNALCLPFNEYADAGQEEGAMVVLPRPLMGKEVARSQRSESKNTWVPAAICPANLLCEPISRVTPRLSGL